MSDETMVPAAMPAVEGAASEETAAATPAEEATAEQV